MSDNSVIIHVNKAGPALDWVKANCPTYITNRYAAHEWFKDRFIRDISYVEFFFSSDEAGKRDMAMFILRWL